MQTPHHLPQSEHYFKQRLDVFAKHTHGVYQLLKEIENEFLHMYCNRKPDSFYIRYKKTQHELLSICYSKVNMLTC